jgi:hypothetical protein
MKMNRRRGDPGLSWRAVSKRHTALAFSLLLGFGASAAAEQILCPEASPYQAFRLGQITWTHEYSTLFLRRVQIGPSANGTRILCEKLHGIVSAEFEGPCTLLPGEGRLETEAESGIKVCAMPPATNRRTNIEDCRIVCNSPDKEVRR